MFANLNDDVVDYVLGFIPSKVAFNLALTCHDGYRYAMPRALSEIEVGQGYSLRGPKQILSFCAFMLGDVSNRISHMRKLTIHQRAFLKRMNPDNQNGVFVYHDTAECGGPLAEVLRHATHLRIIQIHSSELAFSDSRITDAIIDLHGLTEVAFLNAGSKVLRCVSQLSSRPRIMKLDLLLIYAEDQEETDLTALKPHAQSLEVLELYINSTFMDRPIIDAIAPSVRQLKLSGSVKLPTLLRAFPGARVIRTSHCEFLTDLHSLDKWPDVEEVVTTQPVAFHGTARRLLLRYNVSQDPLFTQLVQHASPIYLSCYVGDDPIPTISKSQASRLQHVTLRVVWQRLRIEDDDPELWLISYVTTFVNIPLATISMVIGPGWRDAHRIQPQSLATRIAHVLPSVQFVGISTPQNQSPFAAGNRDAATWYKRIDSSARNGTAGVRAVDEWENADVEHTRSNMGRL